jgi:hypothetical protein
MDIVMELNRIYSFNFPWRGVVVFAGIEIGLAVWIAHLAAGLTGAISVCLGALSVMFIALALIMVTRRIAFPRVLELSEDAVLFPRGFIRTRIIHVPYADIIRISETSSSAQNSLSLVTGPGRFEIVDSHFANIETYHLVRDSICSKAVLVMPGDNEWKPSARGTWREFPAPILRWREPDDWARYRTGLFYSKPLFSRLARSLWFSVRCFGIIILPWLALRFCGLPTSPTIEYLPLAVVVTFFFTVLHWLYAAYPVHATEISFRDNGFSQFFGKQTHDRNYHRLSGWTVVERTFEGRVLLILLLRSATWKLRPYIISVALPDADIRDRVTQILRDKRIPHVPDLMPSWEPDR